jgi:hypothetical protein
MTVWLWGEAFAFTEAVEVPIYLLAFVRDGREPLRPPWQRVALAFAASLLTHPVVWFVFPRLHAIPYEARTALSELFAWAVEAAFLDRLGLRRAALWSLAANAASLGLGLLCRALLGFP